MTCSGIISKTRKPDTRAQNGVSTSLTASLSYGGSNVYETQEDECGVTDAIRDPRTHATDRYHLMPITMSDPQQNPKYNGSAFTKKVIFKDFPTFFYNYRHFVVLLITSQTAEDQLEWCGLVESKIRLLVDNLEHNQHISSAQVHPKCFDYKKAGKDAKTQSAVCQAPFCSMWFIGLEFKSAAELTVDLTEPIRRFTDQLMQQAVNIKMLREGMEVDTR